MNARFVVGGIIVGLVLLADSEAFAQRSWVGVKVMPKQGASLKLDNGRDMWQFTPLPATVEQVKGDWLWIGRVWVKSSQVVPLDQALDYYNEWVRQEPNSSRAYNLRGIVWKDRGKFDKAIDDYTEAIRLDPKSAVFRNTRGNAWFKKEEYENSTKDLMEAVRLDHKNASPYLEGGDAWFKKEEYENSIKDLTEAIRLDPKYAMAYVNRGNAWKGEKEYEKALADCTAAILLDPQFATAYNNRAWIRATCPPPRFRHGMDGMTAIYDASRACELTNWKDANVIDTLAAAYAGLDYFEDAIKWQNKAIELDGKNQVFKDHLALFKAGKPVRE